MLWGSFLLWQMWMRRERVRHPLSPHVPAAVTPDVTSHSPLTQPTPETMSRGIGRIGDWNNNSQSGSDRSVSHFHLFKATSNTSGNPRRGTSGPRIATLRDTTQPDPPARHHASDDEDEDESSREPESWFAGGERRLASPCLRPQSYLIRRLQVGYR
jgi:hypothetical protein